MAIVSVFRPDLGIWALRKSKSPRSMVTSKSHRSSGKSGNPMPVATGGVGVAGNCENDGCIWRGIERGFDLKLGAWGSLGCLSFELSLKLVAMAT